MATQNGCLLLTKLPMELREAVYELAVGYEHFICLHFRTTRPGDEYFRFRVEPGLLATCRQIRLEAACIFYRNATFRIQYSVHTKIFLRQLGPDRIRHLKALHLFDFLSRQSRDNFEWRKTCVWSLADEFATLGLRAKQIKVCLREGDWRSVEGLEDYKAEMERLSVGRGWGKGWKFGDSAVSKPKEA